MPANSMLSHGCHSEMTLVMYAVYSGINSQVQNVIYESSTKGKTSLPESLSFLNFLNKPTAFKKKNLSSA